METYFWSNGLHFSCQRCSKCCRHDPGVVFLSSFEILSITEELNVSVKDFLGTYCRQIYNAHGYRISLKEKPNYDCIFWEYNKGCIIYNVRPIQCSTFPFWENILAEKQRWEEEALYCIGINKGALHDSMAIQACLDKRKEHPILQISCNMPWEALDENTILGN